MASSWIIRMSRSFLPSSAASFVFLFLVWHVVVVIGTDHAVTATTEQVCDAQDGACHETTMATTPKTTTIITECTNQHKDCDYWASIGECDSNPKFMLYQCSKSCQMCSDDEKNNDMNDLEQNIAKRLQQLERQLKEKEEAAAAAASITETPYGVRQEISSSSDDPTSLLIEKRIANMTNYMESIVFQDPGHIKVKNECKNRNKLCAYWATIGECEANPPFMLLQCAPSCYTCHMIDFDLRCPLNASVPSILNPGDLDKLFLRLTTEDYYVHQYAPKILSMPNPPSDLTDDSIMTGPWVVTLENFLTDEECDRLIALGAEEGYEISMDVGAKKFDGSFEGFKNNGRTSTNAWCKGKCFEDPVTKAVLHKIENATGVPDPNSEYLQLLRYEVGQFYNTHHDYIAHHLERQEGVRILTVFLYLNDVEEGGGTDFPHLKLTVLPKRGRALIWPSVLNEDPNQKDPRTSHQALPVEKGIKYGANAWLHHRDFKEAYVRGCH